MTEEFILSLLSENLILILGAVFLFLCIFLGVRIVPQSEKYVVERFGRLHSVLGPGINFIVPFLDVVRHKVSVLERQLPNASQDAITMDNVLVQVETSIFYRVTEPERTVYRIRDVAAAGGRLHAVEAGLLGLEEAEAGVVHRREVDVFHLRLEGEGGDEIGVESRSGESLFELAVFIDTDLFVKLSPFPAAKDAVEPVMKEKAKLGVAKPLEL